MRPSRRTPDKRIIVFPVILSVFYLSFFSCAAKIDKDDEFKSIWNVIEAKIPGWIEYCRRIDPGFDTDNFYLEKSAALKPVSEYSFTEYSPKKLDSIYYYIYSPDSTKFLDIYSVTAELSIENDTIKAWF